MENLNAENIINEIQSLIKALKDCGGWVKRGNGEGWFNHDILEDALALINSQEQRIGELTEKLTRKETEYNELYELLQTYKADSEAYRSYSKTLEKENEGLKTLLDESYDTQNSLTEENKKLTINMNAFGLTAKRLGEENESLRAENEMLLNIKNLNLDKVIADTVRKMQERLDKRFCHDPAFLGVEQRLIMGVIDQTAKEMLEGEK